MVNSEKVRKKYKAKLISVGSNPSVKSRMDLFYPCATKIRLALCQPYFLSCI